MIGSGYTGVLDCVVYASWKAAAGSDNHWGDLAAVACDRRGICLAAVVG